MIRRTYNANFTVVCRDDSNAEKIADSLQARISRALLEYYEEDIDGEDFGGEEFLVVDCYDLEPVTHNG